MPAHSLGPGALTGPRRKIVELLRRSSMSAKEIGDALGVTHNAVRAHLAALMRAGLVRDGGRRQGPSRPTVVYELAPRAESALSRAYIPFVAELLRALGERMSPAELHGIMHAVGLGLAAERPPLRGDITQRLDAARALLADLGALTEAETADHGFIIRGYGCLLAEAVHGRPEVCRAMESLLAELLEVRVEECCERGERPRCCFKIHAGDGGPEKAPRQGVA
jgi:predicted ArsR family transcriptional regulator